MGPSPPRAPPAKVASKMQAARRAFATAHARRPNLALGLLQLLFCDAVLLYGAEHVQGDGRVVLHLAGVATERGVERAGALVVVEAGVGRVSVTGIDQGP